MEDTNVDRSLPVYGSAAESPNSVSPVHPEYLRNFPTENAQREEQKGRHWSNNFEFSFAVVGFFSDLQSLYRFPYATYVYGGVVFMAVYIFLMILLGVPIFYMELSLGQFSGKGPVQIWNIAPLFRGIGIGMVLYNAIYLPMNTVVSGWIIFYLTQSCQSVLPWLDCTNPWNTVSCKNSTNLAPTFDSVYYFDRLPTDPAIEYFSNRVLQETNGLDELGNMRWELVGCTFGVIVLICLVLIGGIKVIGKVALVTVPLVFLCFLILLIRSGSLPGALGGIQYWIIPSYSHFRMPHFWSTSLVYVFSSLGSGSGVISTLASYKKFRSTALRDSFAIIIASIIQTLVISCVVMIICGALAVLKEEPLHNVMTSGPLVIFAAIPTVLGQLPGGQAWCVFFFITVLLLLCNSLIMSYEVVIKAITDTLPETSTRKRVYTTIAICLASFIITLPYLAGVGPYLFTLVDTHAYILAFPLFNLFQCACVGWIYGVEQLSRDIQLMTGMRPPVHFKFLWCFLLPVIFFALLVFSLLQYSLPVYNDYQYPDWSEAIGWALALAPVVPIPVFVVLTLLRPGKRYLSPSSDWRPSNNEFQTASENQRNMNNYWLKRLTDIFKA